MKGMLRPVRRATITLLFVSTLASLLGARQVALGTRAQTVVEARAVYESVERAMRQHQLIERDTSVTCKNGLEARAQVHRDGIGRIRRINIDGGSGDHSESVATYFDTAGRPRFAFVQRGAVNGTQQEERVYLDARGTVVQRLVRRTHGPGYPFKTLTRVPRINTWVRDLCG
jgi:hypothetical protein